MGLYGVQTHVTNGRTECKRNEGEPKVGVVILANRQTSNTGELEGLDGNERAMDGVWRDEELKKLMNSIYDNLKSHLGNLNDSSLNVSNGSEW